MSYCGQCGAKLAPASGFCHSCGTPVAQTPAEVTAGPLPPCPQCGRNDFVQRVPEMQSRKTVLLSPERKASDETDPDYVLAATEKPEQPEVPKLLPWLLFLLIPGINLVMVWFSPVTNIAKIIMALFAVACGLSFLDQSLIDNGVNYLLAWGLIITYVIGLMLAKAKAKRELSAKLAEYSHVIGRWNNLGYCGRCDVIFIRDAVPLDHRTIGEYLRR